MITISIIFVFFIIIIIIIIIINNIIINIIVASSICFNLMYGSWSLMEYATWRILLHSLSLNLFFLLKLHL